HAEAAVLPVSQGCANRSGCIVANAVATRAADVLVMLVKSPEPQRPAADKSCRGDQRPVFTFDLSPEFRAEACGTYGAGAPSVSCVIPGLPQRFVVSGGEFGAAVRERAPAAGIQMAVNRFGKRRHGGFGVSRNVDIHFGIALKILVIAFRKEIR